jgi:hypothetical protein
VEEGAKDTSLRWLDLGLGEESYKDRYANEMRQTRYIRVSRGLPRHVVSMGRELLSTTAARFPQLGDKVREARSSYLALANRVRETGVAASSLHFVHKAVHSVASQDEVLLFEADASSGGEPAAQLLPLTREHLVEGSIINSGDPPTLRYLMRCANRLNQPGAAGFLLQDESGRPIHFLWIDNYDGFRLAEIEHNIEPTSPDAANAAMIFDCWTPTAERGRGHYAAALRLAAAQLRREGRAAWIFSGATNAASLRGVLKAGFQYRFSFIRRTRMGRSVVTRRESTEVI